MPVILALWCEPLHLESLRSLGQHQRGLSGQEEAWGLCRSLSLWGREFLIYSPLSKQACPIQPWTGLGPRGNPTLGSRRSTWSHGRDKWGLLFHRKGQQGQRRKSSLSPQSTDGPKPLLLGPAMPARCSWTVDRICPRCGLCSEGMGGAGKDLAEPSSSAPPGPL